jgi:hypothetical protein
MKIDYDVANGEMGIHWLPFKKEIPDKQIES